MKQITWLSTVGLLMVIFGDCLRKAAMLTAGSNFNHIVQNEKSDTHTLVTSGVYGWFRHPSYVGWFYWSIGTQVLYLTLSCFPLVTCLFLHAAPALYAVETSGCQLWGPQSASHPPVGVNPELALCSQPGWQPAVCFLQSTNSPGEHNSPQVLGISPFVAELLDPTPAISFDCESWLQYRGQHNSWGSRGSAGAAGVLTAGVCRQVLLCNPICVVGYTLASWRFFRERIEEEEITLIHFFGEEYLEYKRKVPSGLPFIKGVKVEL